MGKRYTPIENTRIFSQIKSAMEQSGNSPRSVAIVVRDGILAEELEKSKKRIAYLNKRLFKISEETLLEIRARTTDYLIKLCWAEKDIQYFNRGIYEKPLPNERLITRKRSTDRCFLEYVDGYLTCTHNHKLGEECLMDKHFKY